MGTMYTEFSGSSGIRPISPFTLLYSIIRLHVAITLVLFRCLVVSISGEMALMCELLNNADFPSCYVIKTFVTSSSKCADKNATALPRYARDQSPPYYKFISCYFNFEGVPCVHRKREENLSPIGKKTIPRMRLSNKLIIVHTISPGTILFIICTRMFH